VFLVNPNGILFGKGASVNVQGLVASTLGVSDADFMAGKYGFAGASTKAVSNLGSIAAADGGYVALLGASVSNQGTISARLGTVALAAGQGVTLDIAGDSLLKVNVDQGALKALVKNGGLIQADGGQVLMTAQAAGQLLNTVVNNTGVVQAQTVQSQGGVIKLLGDMASGTVNVGRHAGRERAQRRQRRPDRDQRREREGGARRHVTTAAPQPTFLSGTWLIDPKDYTIAATAGTRAST
jgi:large exoprotein involved in heme utilization and adhesion